jgi:hypothetical protein
VGPAIERDLKSLGVDSVAQLARRSPERLYRQLERATGKKQDPCVLDTFRAAVAQALDPELPLERCIWWHYSGLRKASRGISKTSADHSKTSAARGKISRARDKTAGARDKTS